MTTSQRPKPEGFERYLSDYRVVSTDSYCGEPVEWGFEIKGRMPSDLFDKLVNTHNVSCHGVGRWVIVVDKLTQEQAIAKYGPVSKETKNTIKFGEKTFFKGSFKFKFK